MSATDTEAPPRKIVPISQPVSVLPTNTARIYTNIHPILILSLYYIFFPSLVADPVSTLKQALAPLAHLQIIYCVVCLPPFAGGSSQRVETPRTAKKKRVQFAHSAKGPSAKPATLASRIPVRPSRLPGCDDANRFIFTSPASHIFPRPLPPTRHASTDHHDDSFWRLYKLIPLAYSPLCDTYVTARRAASLLYPWCGRSDVERDSRGCSAFRRGLGRIDRDFGRSLVWRGESRVE